MAVVARPIADPTRRAISTRLSPIESSSSWYASRMGSLSYVIVGVPGAGASVHVRAEPAPTLPRPQPVTCTRPFPASQMNRRRPPGELWATSVRGRPPAAGVMSGGVPNLEAWT
ncbi:hypothetical protein Stsp02_54220 [Streptomyces sp. NBRC 14336]|nr:hypothetical protein Stsp02_54220 [Streptomyces sp. NBRC 14336]